MKVGDSLGPRRVIGPHSVVSFANECRAHRQNIWGTWRWNVPEGAYDPAKEDAGFGSEMTYGHEARKIAPRMGGAYGCGASMNAWHLDTIAYWAGHQGYIWHSKTQFRSPAFGTTGTLTINTAVPANTPESDYRGSYGKRLPGNILKIFDPDTGEVVPRGTRGENRHQGADADDGLCR
ncbi:MAG TPA: hypothetical protein VF475_08930 [Sphingobium sp.]